MFIELSRRQYSSDIHICNSLTNLIVLLIAPWILRKPIQFEQMVRHVRWQVIDLIRDDQHGVYSFNGYQVSKINKAHLLNAFEIPTQPHKHIFRPQIAIERAYACYHLQQLADLLDDDRHLRLAISLALLQEGVEVGVREIVGFYDFLRVKLRDPEEVGQGHEVFQLV